MSATNIPPPPFPPAGDPGAETCPRCGAPLRSDQDWCLSCGAAVTTQVAGAPAWRAPIAIVAAVLIAAALALALAFVELSDDSERLARTPEPTPAVPSPGAAAPVPSPTPGSTTIPPEVSPSPTPDPAASPSPSPGASPSPAPQATTTPAPTTSPAPTPGSNSGAFTDWPTGKTAYTVILWSASTRSEAEAKARGFQPTFSTVGILESSDYSSLRPGYFVVFDGQYDSADEARAAAKSAQSTAPGAYAKRVKP